MRSYVALSGRDGAFGWSKRTEEGDYLISLGGLKEKETYTLPDGARITADDNGRWQGKKAAPLRFAAWQGRIVLCDESSVSWEEAALQVQLPPKEKTVQVVALQEDTREPARAVVYRTRTGNQRVDALPQVNWPKACEQIRRCFETEKPVRVLPYPWRFVCVPGTRGEQLVGCLKVQGKITKTAYAVRARGGLLQPKGLNGYDYVRTDTGENYWMLIRQVR